MRAMPYLVADTTAVKVDQPLITCAGITSTPDDPLAAWDYQQPIDITVGFLVDEGRFRAQTGLDQPGDLDDAVLCVHVDCPATNWRGIATAPIGSALATAGAVRVEIPAGAVAQQLVTRCSVLLDRPDGPPRANRAAHLRGSRLFSNDVEWRVALEGEGAGFPSEAFDFREAGMLDAAPWHLQVRATDLNMPFTKAVRLQINTGHPASEALLKGGADGLKSILFQDVLLQMVLAVADTVRNDQADGWDEDSLGEILDGLCNDYLQTSLPAACDALAADPAEFATTLKHGTALLKDFKS